MSKPQARNWLVPGLWLGVFLLRVLALLRYAQTPFFAVQTGDMRFYQQWGERIAAGQWTDGQAFYGLPGYAYLLGGLAKLVGRDAFLQSTAVGLLQAAAEATTAIFVFKLAKRTCGNETHVQGNRPWQRALPILAAAGWGLFVPAQAFSIILMPTAWVVCAYWGLLWWGLHREHREWLLPWLPMGVLAGVVAMMVATILFAVPLLLARAATTVQAGRPWRERWRSILGAAAMLCLGLGVGTAPAWWHNYFVAREPVLLSAHGGLNFYLGSNEGATGYPFVPPGMRVSQEGMMRDSMLMAEAAVGRPLKRHEASAYWAQKAQQYRREHWGQYLWLKVRTLKNFWSGFVYDDISIIRLLQERGIIWWGFGWAAIAPLGLCGVVLAWGRPGVARWVSAAVLLHMLAILPVFVTERYRLAAAPGLLVLGAGVVAWVLAALAARQWRLPLAAVLILAFAATLVWWPVRDPSLLALQPYNLGAQELRVAENLLREAAAAPTPARADELRRRGEEELSLSEAHLAEAYQLTPWAPELLLARGNAAMARGRRPEAVEWYRATLKERPNHPEALHNLAYVALKEQRWPLAERLLRQALATDPTPPARQYLLAEALLEQGKLPDARAALEKALQQRPQDPQFRALAVRLQAAERGAPTERP